MTDYLLPVQERAAVAVALLLVGQGWPAERAAALVREVVAARREVEIRRLGYVPSPRATMQG